jgi:hypothetical protein
VQRRSLRWKPRQSIKERFSPSVAPVAWRIVLEICRPPNRAQREFARMTSLLRKMAVRLWGSNELQIRQSTAMLRRSTRAKTCDPRRRKNQTGSVYSQQPTTFETRRTMVLGFAPNRHDRNQRWVPISKGVDRFNLWTSTSRQHLCLPSPPPLNRGPSLRSPRWRQGYLGGCGCLALIDSCQQTMIARNDFGQSWMSWSRCLRMRPRQRSMCATCLRREGADGTQRKSSGCASASLRVRGAKRGIDL